MQHEISGPVHHVRKVVLASLQGLRITANNTNRSGQDTKPLAPDSNETFSTFIPTSLLNDQLLLKKPTPSSNSMGAGTVTIESIASMLLDVNHVDVTNLSWLSQDYFRTHEFSSEAILNVAEALLNSVHSASVSQRGGPSSTELLQRYVNLCLTFPQSISQRFTLTPIVNVLSQYAEAAHLYSVDTNNKEVSGL